MAYIVAVLAFLSVKFFAARSNAGDYEGALRRLRFVNVGLSQARVLHHEGLILLLADRPAEAEMLFREAVGIVQRGLPYPRERLYSFLGHALTNLGRYGEAEHWLLRAIGAGDLTGNSQDGLAQLRLAQGQWEEAIAFANQSIEVAKCRANRRIAPVYYQDLAWALASLGRGAEARESLALALPNAGASVAGRAGFEWKTGLVRLALGETEAAQGHFRKGAAIDPNGKVGHRCLEAIHT